MSHAPDRRDPHRDRLRGRPAGVGRGRAPRTTRDDHRRPVRRPDRPVPVGRRGRGPGGPTLDQRCRQRRLAERHLAGRQAGPARAHRSSSTSATATASRRPIATLFTRRPRMGSASTRSPAAATLPISTSARRSSRARSGWHPARSCSSTICATRAATRSPACPEGSLSVGPAAGRQLRGGLAPCRRRRGHRRHVRCSGAVSARLSSVATGRSIGCGVTLPSAHDHVLHVPEHPDPGPSGRAWIRPGPSPGSTARSSGGRV